MGPALGERLGKVPTPTCRRAAEYLKTGVPMKKPTTHYPITEMCSQKASMETRILHRYDLLKGVADGTLIGPIPYTGQTHVRIEGRSTSTRLRGTKVFRTNKDKTMQPEGRPITDSKVSRLNDDYDIGELPCILDSLREKVFKIHGRESLIIVDYKSAYKQLSRFCSKVIYT